MSRPLLRVLSMAVQSAIPPHALVLLMAALTAALPSAALPLGLRLATEAAAAQGKAIDPLALTEAEAYELYAPNTAFAIDLSLVGTNTITLSVVNRAAEQPYNGDTGKKPAVIHWGDGTSSSGVAAYQGTSYAHTYAKEGVYVIEVEPTISIPFWPRNCNALLPAVRRVLRWGDGISSTQGFTSCTNLECFADGTLARWGKGAKEIQLAYCQCPKVRPTKLPEWPETAETICAVYSGCDLSGVDTLPEWPANAKTIGSQWKEDGRGSYWAALFPNSLSAVTRLPEWPTNATKIGGVYMNCSTLNVATLPEWPTNATTIGDTYMNCSSLAATNVPAWPKTLKSLTYSSSYWGVYSGCRKLTATLDPETHKWPSGLTSANYTFYNCSGLTGSVPAEWPSGLTSANYTFYNCSGLTGSVPAWSNCTALTSVDSTYRGCRNLTGSLPAWPPNVKYVNWAFGDCPAFTGAIPAWVPSITQAQYTFMNCRALTGAWTSDPDELMPTNITSHGYCVQYASTALQALFYSDWGGTRTKTE